MVTRTRITVILCTVSGVERELRFVDTLLAEMSKQVSEMQTYARRWTSSAPRDRYEKRVGSSNKFFGPMDWDDTIAFAQTSEQDWVIDPWNFYCMLEHLSGRFPAKVETCKEIRDQLLLAASILEEMLEMGIPDSNADEYLGMLEEQTLGFIGMVWGIQEEVTGQLKKAIDVTRQLERIGIWKD